MIRRGDLDGRPWEGRAARCPRSKLLYVSQTPEKPVTSDATDATDATVTNTAGEFDFYALHHAYLCLKSHSEQ